MADQPLGIADLIMQATSRVTRHPVVGMPDHWYWCRSHQRAEHVGEPTFRIGQGTCIRIGPFMSEAEANILRREHSEFPEGDKPLGMGIER